MLKEKLSEDLKIAMKEKLDINKETIRLVLSAIQKLEKDTGRELNDEQVLTVLMKEKKSREDALELFRQAERSDKVSETLAELEVLFKYLPKQLTTEELDDAIKTVISNVAEEDRVNFGVLIKTVKEKIGNQADGKAIADSIRRCM